MRVLIVKKKNSCWPFVQEQADALGHIGTEIVYHLINGRGLFSYICDLPNLIRDIIKVKPDIIHAHYGMSGYYACLVNKIMRTKRHIPIVVTYHGSDINNLKVRRLSQHAIRMADYNIFVSPKLMEQVETRGNSQVIPCGLNMADWMMMDKKTARKKLGLSPERRYVLFSSDFQTAVKNPELAIQAVKYIQFNVKYDIELIELKGYTREEVNILMHGADVCLMTSFTEGSPQFIKEAMVCGCPIVTTQVGDTKYVIGNTEGCYFTDYSVEDCAKQLERALEFAEKQDRTKGRARIEELGYSNDAVAQKIKKIYVQLVNAK